MFSYYKQNKSSQSNNNQHKILTFLKRLLNIRTHSFFKDAFMSVTVFFICYKYISINIDTNKNTRCNSSLNQILLKENPK